VLKQYLIKTLKFMKSTKIFAFLFVLFLSMPSANAQLGRLLKKNKKGKAIAGKITKKGGASANGLSLDWNTFKMSPSVTFHSLLYGTKVWEGGSTRLETYTATFVPPANGHSEIVDYLKIKVYKGDEFITYFAYDGGQTFDNGKKRKFNAPGSRYQRDGEWVGDTNVDLKKHGVGNYRLDFYAGDKMFYSFDFEVYKKTNDDPYAEMNEMYLSRGPWNDYVSLRHANTGNLIFGFYLNHEEFLPNPSNSRKTKKTVEWDLKLFKDNKLFAKQYSKTSNKSQVERAEWNEFTTAIKRVDKDEVVKFSGLEDGAYKIELTIKDEAKPRLYTFNVKNNKMVPREEQNRNINTDPTKLLEGWNDFIWLKLEK